MSYCLNPACPHPQNLDEQPSCQSCGATLRLDDRYLPLKPIGQGGFGRTFLAVDEAERLKPRCVIKQFFPQQQGTDNLEKASDLFRQEALRLQALGNHSQIPSLVTYLEQDRYQYLIQEFIDGRNLEQELIEDGVFDEAQIQALLVDLLSVLKFIHQHQVIHRDIKPANIIRRRTDRKLVLVDLGAAKYATGTALARTGTTIGSAEFTAPEQTRGKAVFASDLYSLGATCIHLLTGLSPFDLYDGSEGRWVWRDYLSTPVSPAMGQILDKLLQDATKRRYQSVDEVLTDLSTNRQQGEVEQGRERSLASRTTPPEPTPLMFKEGWNLNLNLEASGALAQPASRSTLPVRSGLKPPVPLPDHSSWSDGAWFRISVIFGILALPGLFMALQIPFSHPPLPPSPPPIQPSPIPERPQPPAKPPKPPLLDRQEFKIPAPLPPAAPQ